MKNSNFNYCSESLKEANMTDLLKWMTGSEDSDIIGMYEMYKEQGMNEILEAMGYTYPSRLQSYQSSDSNLADQ